MAFRSSRIHAPEIIGRGGWINTNNKPLTLTDLRGRVVVLDFWTSSCINCIHIMEELRALEERYDTSQLVVVGIHSPKFQHETDHDAVVAAVKRYGIQHPVLDDPDMTTWSAYGIRAWPTLVVVDQEGYVEYIAAGERQLPALIKIIDSLLQSKDRTTDTRHQSHQDNQPGETKQIWYPSKLACLKDGTLLLANTGNHNLLQLTADGSGVLRAIGAGSRGSTDGSLDTAQFSEPTAVLVLDDEQSSQVSYDIIVADRGNHSLRTVSLSNGKVDTLRTGLPSPWDIVYWPAIGRLVIAIAGRHLIASMDIQSGEVAVIAGSGIEGIRDGQARRAEFAQPSGLAAEPGPDGSLWVIDAETSALRRLSQRGRDIFVETAIGRGLFDFGHKDGPASQALLQHPQGVSIDNHGNILIADTFNGAVRKYVLSTKQVSTVIDGLLEPTGILISQSNMLIVESAANRIIAAHLNGRVAQVLLKEQVPFVKTAPIAVAPNLEIEIGLELPDPMHIDEATEEPVRLTIGSAPDELLSRGSGMTHELSRQLQLNESIGSGTIHVAAAVASCDELAGQCTVMTQDWNLHIVVKSNGTDKVKLVLSGPPPSEGL